VKIDLTADIANVETFDLPSLNERFHLPRSFEAADLPF